MGDKIDEALREGYWTWKVARDGDGPDKMFPAEMRAALAEAGLAIVPVEPPPDESDLHHWPEVDRFALLMKQELANHAHKGGWKDEQAHQLEPRVRQEAMELRDLVRDHQIGTMGETDLDTNIDLHGTGGCTLREMIGSECADIANFAMMVADVCGALPMLRASQQETGT